MMRRGSDGKMVHHFHDVVALPLWVWRKTAFAAILGGGGASSQPLSYFFAFGEIGLAEVCRDEIAAVVLLLSIRCGAKCNAACFALSLTLTVQREREHKRHWKLRRVSVHADAGCREHMSGC